MTFISIPETQIPVKFETQVTVLGGGPAGVSAAVSAAKNGAKVILLERYGFLGGQATGGFVLVLCGLSDKHGRIIKGYCQEIIDYLEHYKATTSWYGHIVFEPEVLKRCFDQHIKENKVQLLLHATIVDTIVEDNTIKHVIVESKNGRFAIKTDTVIDCTGDADSLKWCNEDFLHPNKNDLRQVTACFRLGGVEIKTAQDYIANNKDEYLAHFEDFKKHINPLHWVATVNENVAWFDMSHIEKIDITDIEDLTRAELESRELTWKLFDRFKNKIKGFENSFLIEIAPLLGVRDSRRLNGKYFITETDYNKTFNDTICYFPYYFDKEGIGKLSVTYKALVPKRIKNLLIAGRSIGIEHKLIDCMREIPQCIATGQAAGVAASIATSNHQTVNSVDSSKLREILLKQNAYI